MKRFIGVVVLVFCVCLSHGLMAQQDGKQIKDQKPTTEFVARTAFFSGTAFPARIAANPNFKLFPREIVSAWGKKELGFDPMLISEVTWMMKTPKVTEQASPEYAAVLHFKEMQGLAGNMIDGLVEEKIAGKSVFADPERPWMASFMIYDESTIILGSKTFFTDLVSADGRGDLADLMSEPQVRGELYGFLSLKEPRAFFKEEMMQLNDLELPPPVEDLKKLIDLVDTIQTSVSLKSSEMKVLVRCPNEKAAERAEEILLDALEYGKVYVMTQMAASMDAEDPIQVATMQYTNRMAEKYQTMLSPEREGLNLTFKANEQILGLWVMLGTVGSYARLEGPEMRMTPDRQLRQNALAFHNYVSAYKQFPTTIINTDTGEELMSRRVAMLPFLEQGRLQDQLKLDENWNSAHNSQFTSITVPVFGTSENGQTRMRYPVFPNSIWDENKPATGFQDIADGMSNTILAIEAPENASTNWADPQPWKISESNPMRDIFGDRDEVSVAMMDGSTRVLRRSGMTNSKLKALLTYSGGETID